MQRFKLLIFNLKVHYQGCRPVTEKLNCILINAALVFRQTKSFTGIKGLTGSVNFGVSSKKNGLKSVLPSPFALLLGNIRFPISTLTIGKIYFSGWLNHTDFLLNKVC